MGYRDPVTLTVQGGFQNPSSAYPTYKQRPILQETWARGEQEACETHAVKVSDSGAYIPNMLGTVWNTKNRTSGVSRILPAFYKYRAFSNGTVRVPNADAFTDSLLQSGDYNSTGTVGFFRKWYCYKLELQDVEGVPVQWQSNTTDQKYAGAMRMVGNATNTLDSSTAESSGSITDGYDIFKAYYKPQRFVLRTDAEMNALPGDLDTNELGRFVIRDWRYASRGLSYPGQYFYWESDLNTTGGVKSGAVPVPEGPQVIFPMVQLLYKWIDVPVVPSSTIISMIGKVNAAVTTWSGVSGYNDNTSGNFDFIGSVDTSAWAKFGVFDGFSPGTVLFDGVDELIEHTNAAGQRVYDITYSFIWRPQGHNYFYNFGTTNKPTPGFERLVKSSTKNLASANWAFAYESANLENLFVCPWPIT